MSDKKDNKRLEFSDSFKFLMSWKPVEDVFAIKYGPAMAVALSTINAGYIVHIARKKLKLKNFGVITSYAGIIGIPAYISAATHLYLVQKPMITGRYSCPVCLEVRSGVLQLLCGTIYPLLLTPIITFMIANKYKTEFVPSILDNPSFVAKTYYKILKPRSRSLLAFALVNFVGGMALSLMEMSNYLTVLNKLAIVGEKEKVNSDEPVL